VRSWLLATAHHRAVDALRERRRLATLDAVVEAATEAGPSSDVAGDALRALDNESLRETLALLPRDQREAIELA